jgi:hypothetical protein
MRHTQSSQTNAVSMQGDGALLLTQTHLVERSSVSMQKSLRWLGKTSVRTALFVFMAYCLMTPPLHDFDFLPKWLSIGLALGLFWPLYCRLGGDLWGVIADDIATRVEKRVNPKLHPKYVECQLSQFGADIADDNRTSDDEARPMPVYLLAILREVRALKKEVRATRL